MNGFEVPNKTAIYNIGSLLIPEELYNTKEPPKMAFYPDGADSSYDLKLERQREKLAHARRLKKEKEPKTEEQQEDTGRKKGYFQVIPENPEQIPFHAVITHAWPCDEDMFIPYNSEIIASIAEKYREASDLLADAESRALLAAMLISENLRQNPRYIADFDSPVFAVQNGNRASVAYKVRNGYTVLLCELNPLAAYEGSPDSKDPQNVKEELAANSDQLWEVDHDLLMEKMKQFTDA